MRRLPVPLSRALGLLRIDLRGWKVLEGSYAVTVKAPSILTLESYSGTPLTDIVIPPCAEPIQSLSSGFTSLVRWKLGQCQDIGIPPNVRRFVQGSLSRYIVWAGQHPNLDLDIDLECGRALLLGEMTFGLADGQAICETDDYEVPFPSEDFTLEPEFRCRELGFVALYRRARELDNQEALRCLAAIRAYATQEWRQLAPWVWEAQKLPDQDRVSEIITGSVNPAAELYLYLVPEFISRNFYEKRIAPLDTWSLNPGTAFRGRLWDKAFRAFFN